MTVKEGLQAALDKLGPNGETWAKGRPIQEASFDAVGGTVPDGFLCAMTACGEATGVVLGLGLTNVDLFKSMRSVLEAQLPEKFVRSFGGVVPFNDAPETTFADVKALFERAIAATEAA